MSDRIDNITLSVTGLAWMGHGIGSVQSLIQDVVDNANDEIQIAAYMITEGASEFFKTLRVALERGIRLTLIVNRLNTQPQFARENIAKLISDFSHFKALDFGPESSNEDLHAKIIVVDRSKAIVGSSNLTWKGMVLNHELAVMISGPSAARVADLFDRLARDHRSKPIGGIST